MDFKKQFELAKQKVDAAQAEQKYKALEAAKALLSEGMPAIMEAASRGATYIYVEDLTKHLVEPSVGRLKAKLQHQLDGVPAHFLAEQLGVLLRECGAHLDGLDVSGEITVGSYITWHESTRQYPVK